MTGKQVLDYFLATCDWLGRAAIWLVVTLLTAPFKIIWALLFASRRPLKFLPEWLGPYRAPRRFAFLVSLLLVVVLLPAAYWWTQRAGEIEARWWNDHWGYRQRVPINNNEAFDLENFQVLLTLNTQALIADNKLQAGCQDLRLVNSALREVPFWIDEMAGACNTTATKIWANIPMIPADGTNLFVYYGNGTATVSNRANPSQVFEFFEDFESYGTTQQVAAAGWTDLSRAGAFMALDTENGFANSKSLLLDPQGGSGWKRASVYFNGQQFERGSAIDFYYKATDNNYHSGVSGFNDRVTQTTGETIGADGANMVGLDGSPGSPNVLATKANGSSRSTTAAAFDRLGSQTVTVRWNASAELLVDGVSLATTSTNVPNVPLNIFLSQFPALLNYGVGYFDDIRVRKDTANPPTTGSWSAQQQSPAPIAHWNFDTIQGTTVPDVSPVGNTATNYGATVLPADQCIAGKCLAFDGQSHVKTNATNSSLDFRGKSVSVSAWVNLPSGATGRITNQYSTVSLDTDGFWVHTNGANPQVTWNTCGGIPRGEWVHLAGVINTGTGEIASYINGTVCDSDTVSGQIERNYGHIWLGSGDADWNWPLTGHLDEVKIYPYARTADEVRSDYFAGFASAGTSVTIGGQNQSSLGNGLVGYWKMDEASWNGTAGEVRDASGNGNHGVASGGATPGAGKFGNGGSFDGIDSSVGLTNANMAQMGLSDWSIQAWIKTSQSTGTYQIIDKRSSGPSNRYQMQLVEGKIYAQLLENTSNQRNVTGTSNVADGQWHHIVVVFSRSGDMTIFVDGNPEDSVSINELANIDISSPYALRFGSSSYNPAAGPFFSGSLDEVRIYNRALSPAEVSQLYNFAPGPIGHWKFDEGTGTTAYDSSGSGNDGTWAGSTSQRYAQGKSGTAGVFNGVDDYVESSQSGPLANFIGGEITVTAWIKVPSTAGIRMMFFSGGGWNRKGMYFPIDGGRLWFQIGNGSSEVTSYSPALVPSNEWVHVASKWKDGTIYHYINGVEYQGSNYAHGYHSNLSSTLNFGRMLNTANNPGNYLDGLIDDVRIYNYARTPEQILQDMRGSGAPSDPESLETPPATKRTVELGASGQRDQLIDGPSAGPIAYWNFDEMSGSTAGDSAGSYTGTLVGGPEWERGKVGGGLRFNGSTQYVSHTTTPTMTAFSISAWVKTTSTSLMNVVSGSGAGSYISISSGRMQWYDGAGWRIGPTNLNDGRWHHVQYIFDQGKYYMYLDGKLEYADTVGIGTLSNGTITRIGVWSNSALRFFTGSIDEVKIYDYALSPAQVAYEFNRGAPIAHWTMDECEGTTIRDVSGNGHHGTLTIGPSGSQTSAGTCETPGTAWGNGKEGKVNSAMNFDGGDDWVVSNVPSLQSTSTTIGMSISAWIKTSTTTNKGIAGFSYGTSNLSFACGGLAISSNQLRMTAFRSPSYYSATLPASGVATGNWHHLTGIYNGSTYDLHLYVDGNHVSTQNMGGSMQGNCLSTFNGEIGRFPNSSGYFSGLIDDVRIYNYPLSQDQINQLYNQGAAVRFN